MNKIICKWLINNSLKDLFDIVEHNSSTETETLLHREFVVLTNFLHKWSAFCIPLIWSVTHSSYVSVLHITCRYSTHVKNYVHKYTQQPSVCSSSKSVDIIFIASKFCHFSVCTAFSIDHRILCLVPKAVNKAYSPIHNFLATTEMVEKNVYSLTSWQKSLCNSLADCCGQPYFSRNCLFCKHFPTTLQEVGRLWRVIETWIQGKSCAFWHVLTVAMRHNF